MKKYFTKLMTVGMVLIGLATLATLPGCGSSPITPATKQAVAELKNQNAVDKAKQHATADLKLDQAKSKAKLAAVQGQTNPILHPIAASNVIIVKLRPWLIALAVVSFIVFAVGWGLTAYLGTFGAILKHVGGRVFFASAVALFTLPFFPIGILTIVAALAVWFIVELIYYNWNVPDAVSALEKELSIMTGPLFSTATVTVTGALASGTYSGTIFPPASSPVSAMAAATEKLAETLEKKI